MPESLIERARHRELFVLALIWEDVLAELDSLECDHQKEAIWKEEDFASG